MGLGAPLGEPREPQVQPRSHPLGDFGVFWLFWATIKTFIGAEPRLAKRSLVNSRELFHLGSTGIMNLFFFTIIIIIFLQEELVNSQLPPGEFLGSVDPSWNLPRDRGGKKYFKKGEKERGKNKKRRF